MLVAAIAALATKRTIQEINPFALVNEFAVRRANFRIRHIVDICLVWFIKFMGMMQ